MHARLRSILVVAIVLVAVIALIIVEIRVNGTGFKGKTLWDWLQLLSVLAIPVVVGFGAVWFAARQNHDREIALDNQREAVLQTYLDKMSELILHENLDNSKPTDKVRTLASARTITALQNLDLNRKRSIIFFLNESNPIERDNQKIDLIGGDLREVNLSHFHLSWTSFENANLQGANLFEAELSSSNFKYANLQDANLRNTDLMSAVLYEADLRAADLRGVYLREANLERAKVTLEQLKQAKTLQGATMPDGSIHP